MEKITIRKWRRFMENFELADSQRTVQSFEFDSNRSGALTGFRGRFCANPADKSIADIFTPKLRQRRFVTDLWEDMAINQSTGWIAIVTQCLYS